MPVIESNQCVVDLFTELKPLILRHQPRSKTELKKFLIHSEWSLGDFSNLAQSQEKSSNRLKIDFWANFADFPDLTVKIWTHICV